MLKIGTVTDELRMMRLRFTEPENLCDHVHRFSSAHGSGSSTSSRRHIEDKLQWQNQQWIQFQPGSNWH